MPASTIATDVRGAIKTALQSISGLRVFDYVPDSTNIPTNNAFAILSGYCSDIDWAGPPAVRQDLMAMLNKEFSAYKGVLNGI